MTGFLRRAMSVGSVACVIAVAGLGSSSVIAGDSSAEARIEWAKRHVELVCRPLEASKLSARAAKCYEEVSLFIADPKREIPAEVEAVPLRRTAGDGSVTPKAAAPKAAVAAKPAPKATAAAVKPEPKAVVPAPAQTNRVADAKAVDVKRPARRVVRVASIRHPKPRVAVVRPLVVASNDRIPVALAAAQENVTARRCGLPCARLTTILGVGY